jgi:outer membrane protein OmpA-like peptidoglycan-associated protein
MPQSATEPSPSLGLDKFVALAFGGITYAGIAAIGLVGELVYLSQFKVYLLDYATVEDLLFAGIKHVVGLAHFILPAVVAGNLLALGALLAAIKLWQSRDQEITIVKSLRSHPWRTAVIAFLIILGAVTIVAYGAAALQWKKIGALKNGATPSDQLPPLVTLRLSNGPISSMTDSVLLSSLSGYFIVWDTACDGARAVGRSAVVSLVSQSGRKDGRRDCEPSATTTEGFWAEGFKTIAAALMSFQQSVGEDARRIEEKIEGARLVIAELRRTNSEPADLGGVERRLAEIADRLRPGVAATRCPVPAGCQELTNGGVRFDTKLGELNEAGAAHLETVVLPDLIARTTADRQATIYILGYADAFGAAATNLELSTKRANHVKQRIDGKLPTTLTFEVFGRGEAYDCGNVRNPTSEEARRVDVYFCPGTAGGRGR